MTTSKPPNIPLLTFPPFPTLPADSTLPAFKDFKPSGIQLFAGDDEIELDGMGVPTVELRVKHNLDEPKTGKKKGKKKNKIVVPRGEDGEPIRRMMWWEEWEEGEDLRVSGSGYPLAISRVDRLFKASRDFAEGRKWPPMFSGVRAFWDQYRLYLGLLTSAPVFQKPTKGPAGTKRARDEPDVEDSGDEYEPSSIVVDRPVSTVLKKPRLKREVDNDDLDDDNEEDEDDGAQKIDTEEVREERLMTFLNDPEKSTRVFLSSYMREQGLIWADRNLNTGPRLTKFFINFLLRNRVLPEPNQERGLRHALDTSTLALKELPLTAKMGRSFPDQLSVSLTEFFGRKASVTFEMDVGPSESWGNYGKKNGDDDERDAKRLKVDNKVEDTKDDTVPKVEDEFEAELKAANAELIPKEKLVNIHKEIIEDNIGTDVDVDMGGWNNPSTAEDQGSWGDWGATADLDAADSVWGNFTAEAEENPWGVPKENILKKLIGPNIALPNTHTTGIVEQSTRRIKSIINPPVPPTQPSAKRDDAEGVEEDLDRLFAKVILEPWVGDASSDTRGAVIRTHSKGLVAPGSTLEDGSTVPPQYNESGEEIKYGPEVKIHNPLETEITLLVEPDLLDTLSVGMGMLATWIQIVRQEEKKKKSDGSSGTKNKKKKKRSKGYWYMEELLVTFPSFYTQEK